MKISRRTLLSGLVGSSLYWTLKPMVGALSFNPAPPTVNDIFLWLHGLMAIVVDQGSIRILSPTATQLSHVRKFGRITPAADSTANLTGACSIQMSNRSTALPRRDSAFDAFVAEGIKTADVNAALSAFVLTLPYPDDIYPVRVVATTVHRIHGGVWQATDPVRIPLTIIFHYKNVDLSSVTTTGGITLPNSNGQQMHAHVFVEPDPADEVMHESQPDLDALMNMFSMGIDKIVIDHGTDPCPVPGPTPKRHCYKITDITNDTGSISLPGADTVIIGGKTKITEQLSIFEWKHDCHDAHRCLQPNTYETGACPPRIFLTEGTSWPTMAPAALKANTHKKPALHKKGVAPKKP